MRVIALTGGIASGKSTISSRLSQLGASVVDADLLSREAVDAGSPGLAAIAERFGSDVIAADGSLDRAALGSIVFADEAARNDLNAIVHPEVRRLAAERLATIARNDPDAIAVYDVPLLVETGVDHDFDLVVVADADAEIRTQRLISLRNLDPVEARRRVVAQASDEERRRIADVLIDTTGSLEETEAQVDSLWADLVAGRR
ncbi:dephospho-CoA kinase [Labedella gwakjiensis]|uniref:Dephospho-CoA kinase n=1 Tax=Labedella gwakjiensis TaxID=390269 RepID=A0A2P8GZW8_9MICO|nr:dephospho-CoA kinase [Labedella gwakjiensis]PSL39513.1 dephospho-CoA kinase [Labedella gwakjiensis]RUQ86088.1 dephospho-CoA kinase [Labedella gwakjiensis]